VSYFRFDPGTPLVDEVIAFMKERGFQWYDVMGILRRPSDDALAQMDLLFVRADHPLRAAFDTALRDFVDRLQHAPDVIARAEALKQEWLSDPAIADLSARLWEALRRAVATYATRADGAAPGPLERGLSEFGAALLGNDALLAELDDIVIDLTASVVERYRHEIGDLIAQTVAGWDPEATARRFELAVGRDLQFVRINGTIVGGLVGLVIHGVSVVAG
jgi:uncharacterized membrane-anchored protein YjiN (DUF445 family)